MRMDVQTKLAQFSCNLLKYGTPALLVVALSAVGTYIVANCESAAKVADSAINNGCEISKTTYHAADNSVCTEYPNLSRCFQNVSSIAIDEGKERFAQIFKVGIPITAVLAVASVVATVYFCRRCQQEVKNPEQQSLLPH